MAKRKSKTKKETVEPVEEVAAPVEPVEPVEEVAAAPAFSCTVRCTRPLTFGNPHKRYLPGDTVTVEARTYKEFVEKCAPLAVHFQELVEGQWPDKPYKSIKLRPRKRGFLQAIVEKAKAVKDAVVGGESEKDLSGNANGPSECDVCGQQFKNEAGLKSHQEKAGHQPEQPEQTESEKKSDNTQVE